MKLIFDNMKPNMKIFDIFSPKGDIKRYAYIVLMILASVVCGCDKNQGESGSGAGSTDTPTPPQPAEPSLVELICEQWHAEIEEIDAEIYASFSENGTFELYQKIGDGAFRLYCGKWGLEDDVISGNYNDGSSWSCTYKVEVDGDSMKWTSENEFAEETSYRKTEIPSEVKDNCIIEVKSEEAYRIW